MFRWASLLSLPALAVAMASLATTGASASDHIDSPSIAQDRGSDLTDTFAFVDPNDRSQVVLLMGTQGFIVSGEHFGMPIFDQYTLSLRDRE